MVKLLEAVFLVVVLQEVGVDEVDDLLAQMHGWLEEVCVVAEILG